MVKPYALLLKRTGFNAEMDFFSRRAHWNCSLLREFPKIRIKLIKRHKIMFVDRYFLRVEVSRVCNFSLLLTYVLNYHIVSQIRECIFLYACMAKQSNCMSIPQNQNLNWTNHISKLSIVWILYNVGYYSKLLSAKIEYLNVKIMLFLNFSPDCLLKSNMSLYASCIILQCHK